MNHKKNVKTREGKKKDFKIKLKTQKSLFAFCRTLIVTFYLKTTS